MRRKLSIPAAVLVALVGGMIYPTVSWSAAADNGKTVYAAKCAKCHGENGNGDTKLGKSLKLKDLASAEVQKMTEKEMVELTTKGKNKMPAYEKKLSAQEIADVVAYVRTLKR